MAGSTWSFICISSLLKQPDSLSYFDRRVSIPPTDTTPFFQLPSGQVEVSLTLISEAPLNASEIKIRPVGFEFRAPLIQQRLHQTLITPGCFVHLGGVAHFKVLEASPRPKDRKGSQVPLYRIVASTRIVVEGEGQSFESLEENIDASATELEIKKKKGKKKK